MPRETDTVIIGGGIAGLSCARRLHERGSSFVLVTDRLGGRMHAKSGPPSRNFGATYLTSDYRNVLRFVRPGRRVRMNDVYFLHDGERDRFRKIFHPSNICHSGKIARLYRGLIEFRRRLNALRGGVPFCCQAELLQQDSVLLNAVREPAEEFVRRNGLEEVDRLFTNPIVSSTVFSSTQNINTFYYLACLMPILLPTYVADFSSTLDRMTAGYERRIDLGKVLQVEPAPFGKFLVGTETRLYRARSVVIATPVNNARSFCPDSDWLGYSKSVRTVSCCAIHVQGRRRRQYLPGRTVFPGTGGPATVLLPLGDYDLVFSREPEPDLSVYYERPRVDGRVCWKTAVVLAGDQWRPLSPRPNLYTIGDHNICGVEDSFLTGLYAANDILARQRFLPSAVKGARRIHWIPRQASEET